MRYTLRVTGQHISDCGIRILFFRQLYYYSEVTLLLPLSYANEINNLTNRTNVTNATNVTPF